MLYTVLDLLEICCMAETKQKIFKLPLQRLVSWFAPPITFKYLWMDYPNIF
ncbi:hypothetical protein [Phormidesmis sp. 146-20]